jgi:uncharacterized RDD family membrane protein YckC
MKISPFPLLRGGALALLVTLALPAFALDRAPPPDDYADAPQQGGNDRVSVMSNNYVAANEKVAGNAVAVMGNNVVDGAVGHDVVTVMGNAVINGTVGHNVVATMGNVVLGPHAEVDGDVVAVGGRVQRAPGAIIRGRTVSGSPRMNRRMSPWLPGYPAGIPYFGNGWPMNYPAFHIVWSILIIVSVGFCTLLALVFPGGIRRCGDMLEERPGITVLAAFIALLALPMLFILLCVTIVGIPVAILFLPLGVLAAELFGKASVYGFIGRSLSRDRAHPALAVLLGGIVCGLFYFIPIIGIMISIGLSFLGLGCVVMVLLSSRKPAAGAASPPQPVAQAPAPPSAAVSAPLPPVIPEPPPSAAPQDSSPLTASSAVAAPALVLSSTLPRAGFWIRMGALFIDFLIIGSVFGDAVINRRIIHEGFHMLGSNCLLPLAIYGALMWKLKGATIGGLVCGLRVVRQDDRPIEWETAIVRALSCFLSMILGLGFFWIAFDPEKQAWHDKIAGTIVVRVKGKSLL